MFISSSTSFRPASLPNGPAWTGEASPRDHFSIADIVAFCRRHWMLIVLPMVATLILSVAYVRLATPIFTARAQIIIDPRIQEQWNGQVGNAVLALDTAQVESQIAVLRSERIAKNVIAELNLADTADFQPKTSFLRRLLAPVWAPPTAGMSPLARERFVIDTFAANLDVRRSGMSYAIDISFSSPNPERAAQVANATADAYIRGQLAARSDAARVGGDWLEARTLELRDQMSAATRAVQQFKARRDYRIAPATGGEGDGAAAAKEANPPAKTLEELEATAQIYQRVYESFLQGFTEAVQRQSFPVADARVLTSATVPFSKSRPRGSLIVALGLLMSGLAGAGAALLRQQLDHTVRSRRQVRAELGIECLGSLSNPAPPSPRPHLHLRPLLPGRKGKAAKHVAAPVPPRPLNIGELTAIRERIEICMRPAERFSFGITSHSDGEGKSFLAENLGHHFSLGGRRTLVVDASGSSSMPRIGGASPRPGLLDVVAGHVGLDQVVRTHPGSLVDMLSIGSSPSLPAIFHQGNTMALRSMMADTLKDYDVVIFDLPAMTRPLGGVAMHLYLDSILLVIESGKVTWNALEEDIHWLRTLQTRVMGAVITKCEG